MIKYFSLLVFLLLICSACNNLVSDVDITDLRDECKVKIKRFDKDLFALPQDSIGNEIFDLRDKYPSFLSLFNHAIINIGGLENKNYGSYLLLFTNTYRDVFDHCQEVYDDLTWLENNLTDAFSYYKHYFPESVQPQVYTHISGFNQSIVVADSILSISLEKYLGAQNEYYTRLALPQYMRRRMDKSMIQYDCMRAWVSSEFETPDSVNTLASHMIYNGKVLYFLDAVFPDGPDSLKIGFTTRELGWCDDSESSMWTYLVENKLLFTTDYKTIIRFIDEAPFTAAFSNDSPGRAANWVGWQIVKSYMDENPDVSIHQLMQDWDYMKILNSSGYNP